HLSRAGGCRNERGYPGICDMLGTAAAMGERPGGKRDHRGVSRRICFADRRGGSDLASHADAGALSGGAIALSRQVHAQRDWSSGARFTGAESASFIWSKLSADLLVPAVDRDG